MCFIRTHTTKQYANCRQTLAHAKAINRKRATQTLATADSYSPWKKGNHFSLCFMETSRRKRTCRSQKEVPLCFVMHADQLGFPYLYLLACFLFSFLFFFFFFFLFLFLFLWWWWERCWGKVVVGVSFPKGEIPDMSCKVE